MSRSKKNWDSLVDFFGNYDDNKIPQLPLPPTYFNLGELLDVNVSGVTAEQTIAYNATLKEWQPAVLPTLGAAINFKGPIDVAVNAAPPADAGDLYVQVPTGSTPINGATPLASWIGLAGVTLINEGDLIVYTANSGWAKVGNNLNLGTNADWAELDPNATAFIKNKPSNWADFNVDLYLSDISDFPTNIPQSNWTETVATESTFILNKPTNLSDFDNDMNLSPQIHSDWNQSNVSNLAHILNKPTNLSDFNIDISVDDLSDFPEGLPQSDWDETDSDRPSYILNKPENLSDLDNDLPEYTVRIGPALPQYGTGGTPIPAGTLFFLSTTLRLYIYSGSQWLQIN